MSNARISILLIDDDNLVARSLARMLRGKSYDVSICPDPQQAIKFCDKMQFDLIITDQRMPVMNGTEFAKVVKDKQPNARVILISGYSDKEMVEEALEADVVHQFISKPWDNVQLMTAVVKELMISRVDRSIDIEFKDIAASF